MTVALDKLVSLGEATAVTPTTDTGWETYLAGSGRCFLPAGTNYCKYPSFETGAVDQIPTGWENEVKNIAGAAAGSMPSE